MAPRTKSLFRRIFDERGDMLIQFVIATIGTAVLIGIGGPILAPSLFDRYRLAQELTSEINLTQQLGMAHSGVGATLYVNSDGSTTTFTRYVGRPEAGEAIATGVTSDTFNGSVSYGGATQFGVFASSSGGITALAWTPAVTNITETACVGSLSFTVTTSLSSRPLVAQCQ